MFTYYFVWVDSLRRSWKIILTWWDPSNTDHHHPPSIHLCDVCWTITTSMGGPHYDQVLILLFWCVSTHLDPDGSHYIFINSQKSTRKQFWSFARASPRITLVFLENLFLDNVFQKRTFFLKEVWAFCSFKNIIIWIR